MDATKCLGISLPLQFFPAQTIPALGYGFGPMPAQPADLRCRALPIAARAAQSLGDVVNSGQRMRMEACKVDRYDCPAPAAPDFHPAKAGHAGDAHRWRRVGLFPAFDLQIVRLDRFEASALFRLRHNDVGIDDRSCDPCPVAFGSAAATHRRIIERERKENKRQSSEDGS